MKNIIFWLIAFISMTFYSCKKSFLDNVTTGSILIRQDYVINLKTTGEYLNGVYANMGANLFSDSHIIYPDIVADNIKPSTAGGRLSIHYNWAQSASESGVLFPIQVNDANCNNLSYISYQIIRSANFVIEKANEYKSQDETKANYFKGQALAIRALTHFVLVNFFAQQYNFTETASHPGIAYIKSSNWTNDINGRNSVGEVYDNMIKDLNDALVLLPSTSTGTLKLNRNAVRALLSRIYLFKGDWMNSKNLSRQVINVVPLLSADYPAKLFTASDTEALFQAPPSGNGIVPAPGYSTNFASFQFRANRFLATEDISLLLNEDPGDVRKNWITRSGSNWTIIKFPTGVVPAMTSVNGSYYHTVIRTSEMYLSAAESYAQLGNADSARFYLNAIKLRANPAVGGATENGDALLNAIYKERRKELAFEGMRLFDLLRWKKSIVRNDAWTVNAKELPYPSDKVIAPIPQLDVKLYGFAQNPSY